jgi:carbon monoxide dehydrogenase subunit G
MEGAVTAYERPRRLEMTLTDKLFTLVVVFSLESAGAGTRFAYDMRITPTSFMAKLMSPMIRSSTQKQITKDVAKLKSILESA